MSGLPSSSCTGRLPSCAMISTAVPACCIHVLGQVDREGRTAPEACSTALWQAWTSGMARLVGQGQAVVLHARAAAQVTQHDHQDALSTEWPRPVHQILDQASAWPLDGHWLGIDQGEGTQGTGGAM